MNELLFISSTIALILIIWFKTDAFIEYCKLLKLNFLSNYKDYLDKKNNVDVRLDYIGYLKEYRNNFFTRLITCPICLSIWLSIFINLIFYKIDLIPTSVMLSLLIFTVLDRLMS